MRLTDTQLIILGDAAKRDDGIVILTDRLKGSARAKVIRPLLRAKLLEEMPNAGALPPWRRDDKEGTAYALRITKAGLKAISADEEAASGRTEPSDIDAGSSARRSGAADSQRPQPQSDVRSSKRRTRGRPTPKRQPSKARKPSKRIAAGGQTRRGKNDADPPGANTAPRESSKVAGVIKLLRRPKGASIQEIVSATGWLPHTARAALTGLRKRGLLLERTKEARGKQSISVYRISGV